MPRIIGINNAKSVTCFAVLTTSDVFKIDKTPYVSLADDRPASLVAFTDAVRALLEAVKPDIVGIVRRSSGIRGASVVAIKAEGVCELLVGQLGIEFKCITPQSLKAVLGCGRKQKWQNRAKDLFCPNREILHWSFGFDGAVAAAYKVHSDLSA